MYYRYTIKGLGMLQKQLTRENSGNESNKKDFKVIEQVKGRICFLRVI